MSYLTLLMLGALDAAGYSIIAPVVPEISRTAAAGPTLIGALIATFPAGMVIGFALAGAGVQRGRSSVVIGAGLTLVMVGSAGFVVGESLPEFFAARFVMGLGSGCVWIGVTFSTLERWPGQEYLCMSRVFAAYSVGGLIGPALGAIHGIAEPFLAYGLLAAGALILLLCMPGAERARRFAADRAALRSPGFWTASAAIAFTVLALGIVEGVVPLHLATRLTQGQIGLLYASIAVLVAASAIAAARFTHRRDVLAAGLLITAGLALVGATNTVPAWIAALTLTAPASGSATPAPSACCSTRSTPTASSPR